MRLFMLLLSFMANFNILLRPVSSDLTEEEEEMIDSFMEELVECRGMPGAAISVVRDGSIELARGYGYANIENNEPWSDSSVFAIASVTKSFTATLAAKLFESIDYEVNWDTVVRDVLGDDFHFIDGYRSNNTMFRDLLSHQTGIPRHDTNWVLDAAESREQIVTESIRFMEGIVPMRSDYFYTNHMYTTTGVALEQMFGQSWEDLLTENLLQPLNMTETTFYDQAAPDYNNFVTPYTYNLTSDDPELLRPTSFSLWSGTKLAGPAASISSSARDMARWLLFVLSGGVAPDGTRLVNQTDMQRLWFPESAIPLGQEIGKPYDPYTDVYETYGLGYVNGHYRGYRTHSHTGGLTGYSSEIYFVPDMGVGTFFETNFGGHDGEMFYVHRFLVDVMLGYEPTYNATEVCEIYENLESIRYNVIKQQTPNIPRWTNLLKHDKVFRNLETLGLDKMFFDLIENPNAINPFSLTKVQISDLTSTWKQLQKDRFSPARYIENYFGEYGNFVFGNLTITNSTFCADCLFLQYGVHGQFILQPTDTADTYFGLNLNPSLPWTPVQFSGEDDEGNAMEVVPLTFSPLFPPVFHRELQKADAPPPRNDLCGPPY